MSFVGEKAIKKENINKGEYNLKYALTEKQKEASNFILDNIKTKHNCAINAVCGAGKTEITYEAIKYCLNNNLKIGIAIPRKDVVIELQERLKKDFDVNVIAVYGGHHSILESDIIVFTTHQAYRYENYFDILIIDEVDAFPYSTSETLHNLLLKTSDNFVYLSATMPIYIEEDQSISKYYLNRRYHGCKLPVPKCKTCFFFALSLKKLLKKYKDKVVLVYFPTIKIQMKIAKIIKCDYLINSKSDKRDELLSNIRKLNKGIVFTTTVLERGITIKDVQVIVYNAEHKLFNRDSLVQISGRVGRNKDYPSGNVIFLCKEKNKSIKEAIKFIKKRNE